MCKNLLNLNELKFTVNITHKALHKRDPQNIILKLKRCFFFFIELPFKLKWLSYASFEIVCYQVRYVPDRMKQKRTFQNKAL